MFRLARTTSTGALFLGFLLAVAGCGGGGGSGSGGGNASVPSISNLRYSPTSAPFAQGGIITVSGSIDFSDPGGDIASLGIETFDPSGVSLSKTSTPVPSVGGITSGPINGVVSVSTAAPGMYSFHIWVTDAKGTASNVLSGTLQVSMSPGLVTATGAWAKTLVYGDGKLYWSETGDNPVRSISVPGGTATTVLVKMQNPVAIVSAGLDTVWLDAESGFAPSGCSGAGAVRVLKRTDSNAVTTVLATSDNCTLGTDDVLTDGTNIYWLQITNTASSILSTPVAGGNTTVLASTNSPATVLALQLSGGSIFWLEAPPAGAGSIRSVPTGGGPITTYVSGFATRANTFAIDSTSIYYVTANFPSSDNLLAVPIGGGAATSLATVANTPVKLVVASGRLAWVDNSSVQSLPVTGGTPLQLAASAGTPTDILIDASNVVWSETNGSTTVPVGGFIKSVPIGGGTVSVILQDPIAPSVIALDSSNQIEWLYGGIQPQIARISSAGVTQIIVSGIATDSPSLALGSSDLFVVDGMYIKQMPLAGGPPQTIATESSISPIQNIATDNSFVYWDDFFSSVYRVPVGGGNIQLLYAGNATIGPGGAIRIGPNGNVYWISGLASLMTVPSAGGAATTLMQGMVFSDVAVDANNAYVSTTQSGNIFRIPLSGGAPVSFAGALGGFYVSLALSATDLYWIDTSTIQKVPKGGGTPTVVAQVVGANVDSRSTACLALDATNVYWTEQPAMDIRSAPQ